MRVICQKENLLRWIFEVDMRVGGDRENLPKEDRQWERGPCDEWWNKRGAITQNQHQEWKTKLYRRVNDISKDTWPALMMYACYMVEKEITWKEYKKMDNSRSRSCLVPPNLLESPNVSRWEIDDAVRRYKWDASEEQLR